MASNVVENFFYHIIKSAEKGTTISVALDENIKNEMLVKSIVPICGPGFDLLLMEGLKCDYDASQYCNVLSLFDRENTLHYSLRDYLPEIYNEHRRLGILPRYLIIDSIDLLLMQKNKQVLVDFIQFFAVRYTKVIYFYTYKILTPLFAEILHNLSGSLFYFNKPSFTEHIIKVNYRHLRSSDKVMTELITDKYCFYMDPFNFANYIVPYVEEGTSPNLLAANFAAQLTISTDVDTRRLPDYQNKSRQEKGFYFDYLPDKFDDVDEDDPDEDLLI